MTVCECSMTDDEVLTEYAKTRSPDAFAALYGRLHPTLLKKARRILHSCEDAEDVVQDALHKLLELDTPPVKAGYLLKMVQNLAIDLRRRKASGLRRDMESLDDEAHPEIVCEPIDPPDVQLQKEEDRQEVRDALGQLTSKQRRALEVYYDEAITIAGTARELGIGEDAAESLIRRGRDRMRRILGSPVSCAEEYANAV